MSSKQSAMMPESLVDFPPNILLEILVRLPIETLFAARCVCKTFLNLTCPNPHFTAVHASVAAPVLVSQFVVQGKPSRRLQSLDPELHVAPESADYIGPKPLFLLPKIQDAGTIYYRCYIRAENKCVLVNSCNGLLYLVRRSASDERSVVCNPVTNEYLLIRDVDEGSRFRTTTMSMWLGFDEKSNRYKIVRIFISIDNPSMVGARVLVIGCNVWRDIDDPPLGYDHSCYALLNGVIYWLHPSQGCLVWFDFGTEKFGEVPMPYKFSDGVTGSRLSLGVLEGRLCLSYNDLDGCSVDLWVMKEKGNWSKEYVVEGVRGRHVKGRVTPLQVLRNGDIIMHMGGNDLVYYDPRNKGLRFVEFHRVMGCCKSVVMMIPTFVSLKDILRVDKVNVLSERPRASWRVNESDP